jgi:hypothetical protein
MQKTPLGSYYVQDREWYDERRALILKARREGQTLKAIGDTWGITASGVSLVISRALKSRKSKDSGDKTGANPRWTRRKGAASPTTIRTSQAHSAQLQQGRRASHMSEGLHSDWLHCDCEAANWDDHDGDCLVGAVYSVAHALTKEREWAALRAIAESMPDLRASIEED